MTREDFNTRLENVAILFEQVSNTNKKLAKIALLSSYTDTEFLQRILFYTYNPYFVYGIGKKTFGYPVEGDRTQFETIFELLDYLKITSIDNDTKNLVQQFVAWFNRQNLLEMIILKNLKIGIDIETINKVFPKLIPSFKVQLCETFESEKDIKSDMLIIQPKLDGVRCIAFIKQGGVELYTRNGGVIEGYDEIEEQLITNWPADTVLDGEIIGDDFKDTMEGLFAKSARKKASYWVFDMLTVQEFNERSCRLPYFERYTNYINNKYLLTENSVVKPVIGELISKKDFLDNPEDVIIPYLQQNFEGIVLKTTDGKYEYKRSKSWVKYKLMITEEFNVTGFISGDGKYLNSLGAIEVTSLDGSIESKVGSGFTDEQRDYIWTHQDELMWTKCEIKYQERTPDNSLRFPVFIKFRNDI